MQTEFETALSRDQNVTGRIWAESGHFLNRYIWVDTDFDGK